MAQDHFDDPVAGSGHYAWRWDDIWLVNLNLKVGNPDEVVVKDGKATRYIDPHAPRRFLRDFLAQLPSSAQRQLVIISHYGLNESERMTVAEKTAFCAVLDDARTGTGMFTAQKLSKTYPVVAALHGHKHNVPTYAHWTCPAPYGAIVIPRFEVGTPLHIHPDNANHVQFTIFRLGKSQLEAVGVRAPVANPTGAWSYSHKTRLGVLLPP
jgi:hypothetical protein